MPKIEFGKGGGARECEGGGQTQINRLQGMEKSESERREVKRLLSFVGLGGSSLRRCQIGGTICNSRLFPFGS